MKRLVAVTCWISAALLSLPSIAQEGRVELASVGSKELKRSAYRLHMTAERLKNAREALREATDLARHTIPIPTRYFFQLGDLWVRLNRPKAEDALKNLLFSLRSAAQAATDQGEYSGVSTAAQMLIGALAQIDPEQSIECARDWPSPPQLAAGETQTGSGMERQFRRSAVQRLAYSDPDAALKLWSEGKDGAADDYDIRGSLVASLMQNGRSEDANRILDQTVANFSAAKTNVSAWNSYANFLTSIPQAAPDRFLDAFRVWANSTPPLAQGMVSMSLQVGDTTVQLDSNQAAALNVLRSLGNRPELMMNALDSMPSLKTKVDQAGGIDLALNGTGPRPAPAVYRNSDGSTRAAYPDSSTVSPQKLLSELRGKATTNPGLVRSKLAALVHEPDDVAQVMQVAMMSIWQDPDLGCLTLEIARPIVLRIDSPSQQLPLFQQLLQVTRQCDGETDPELIKQGFILADQLRQAEGEQRNGPAGTGYWASDQLETMLLSEFARDNFDAAMRYVRTMEDDQKKLGALLGIIQGCSQQF